MRGDHRDAEVIKQEKARNKEAIKMSWYPISYTILVGSLSINRWRSSFKPLFTAGVEKLNIVPTSVVLFNFGLSARRREDVDEEEDWDEGYFDTRRRSEIELPDERDYPPLPKRPTSTTASFTNRKSVQWWGGGTGSAWRSGPHVDVWFTLGIYTALYGYTNHSPGADDSTMKSTCAGSSRYTTATTSAGGTISAGSGGPSAGGSGPSPTRFREHFHDEDVPVSGIRTIPMNQQLAKQQSMTRPVMSEPPSTMLRRQASSGDEPLLTTLPGAPDAIYSRSAGRIPPSSSTAAVAPPAVPPTGYPPPDSTRPRMEEWALGTAPPQPPRGPAP